MPRHYIAVAILALFAFACNDPRTTKPAGPPPNYKAIAQRGVPVVQALYNYKHDVGLWPQTLEALVPDYATAAQVKGWRYVWYWWGRWKLENYEQFPTARVQYEYCEGHTGWFIDSGEAAEDLELKPPVPATQAVDPKELTRRAAAELHRRIAADPDDMEHARGLVCVYIRAGDLVQARAAHADFAKRFPKHFWGLRALSYIDAKDGKVEAGEQRLTALVAADPSLPSQYALFDYYRTTTQKEKALKVIAVAAALGKDQLTQVELVHPVTVLFNMAHFADDTGDYNLLLRLVEAWLRTADADGAVVDPSYLPLRALAYLRLGKYAEAQRDYQATLARRNYQALWLHDAETIKAAIDARDSRFEYKGWAEVADPPVLTPYE